MTDAATIVARRSILKLLFLVPAGCGGQQEAIQVKSNKFERIKEEGDKAAASRKSKKK